VSIYHRSGSNRQSADSLYDAILGHELMVAARMIICCETQTTRWKDLSVPWKDPVFLRDRTFHQYLKEAIPTTRPELGLDNPNPNPDPNYTIQLTS
jgi:hypothetical protein